MGKHRIVHKVLAWRRWRASNLPSNFYLRSRRPLYPSKMSILKGNDIPGKETQQLIPPSPNNVALESVSAMVMGGQSSKDQEFCPWRFVKYYPRLIVDIGQRKKVQKFLKLTLFEKHCWDFFCLPYPGTMDREPLLLVPSSQFQQYLKIISAHLGLQLEVPKDGPGVNFFVTFGENGTPIPRFLGRASHRDAFRELTRKTHRLPVDDLSQLTLDALQKYRKKIDELYKELDVESPSKRPDEKKPQGENRYEEKSHYALIGGRLIDEAQSYLKLRKPLEKHIMTTDSEVDTPTPSKAEDSVRFIAVDVEVWELSPLAVTEVGLAVLDTRDIADTLSGADGHGWFPLIKSYHFIIEENKHMVNHRFVNGRPMSFNFGVSEFISRNHVNRAIGKIIGDDKSDDQRPVILVGHDVDRDLEYITKLGYNIWKVPQVIQTTHNPIDTLPMFYQFKDSGIGRSLGAMCEYFNLSYYNLHNAGNDATYTLQAMIAMAFKKKNSRAPFRMLNLQDQSPTEHCAPGKSPPHSNIDIARRLGNYPLGRQG
ncbi:uncharacterized protein F4812DRAFT_326799 [Daldinia caldariorum]|uniref:uncharacterized protein n=1 Tax=Daldinia caldariorum TaxID=326644 RepID=UPI002007880C|nr:uncharacterized protein F4812DRAFT_326799 [Daldinia caldariorum]KAI1469361.1 hypothetical protein F4812DRAFT_326799 [Daldinia caldariorum]